MGNAGIIWIFLPLLGIIALAILRPPRIGNRRSAVIGLVIAATIYGIYYLWSMAQGRPIGS